MAATTRNWGVAAALWLLLSHFAQKKNTRDFYLFESHGLWCHKWTFSGVSFDLVYEGLIVITRDNTKSVAQIVSDVFPRSVSDIRKYLKGLFMSLCAFFLGELINLAMFCERIRRRFWPEWFQDVEDLYYDGDSESSRASSPEGLLDFGLFSRTDTLDNSDASSHLTGNTHTNCPDSDHSLFDSDVGTGSDNDTQFKEDLMPELEVWPEYAHDGLTLMGCSVPPPSPLNEPPSWWADWVSIYRVCGPNLIHLHSLSSLVTSGLSWRQLLFALLVSPQDAKAGVWGEHGGNISSSENRGDYRRASQTRQVALHLLWNDATNHHSAACLNAQTSSNRWRLIMWLKGTAAASLLLTILVLEMKHRCPCVISFFCQRILIKTGHHRTATLDVLVVLKKIWCSDLCLFHLMVIIWSLLCLCSQIWHCWWWIGSFRSIFIVRCIPWPVGGAIIRPQSFIVVPKGCPVYHAVKHLSSSSKH